MNLDLTDPNLFFTLLGAILAMMGSGLVIFGIYTWLTRGNKISTRLVQFVAAEVQSPSKPIIGQIIPREIKGSLFSRTIVSWIEKIIHFLERITPAKMAADVEHKLAIAGNPANLHSGKFFAIRFLGLLTGIFLAFLINHDLKNISLVTMMAGFFVIVIGAYLPVVWLTGRVQSKQYEIRRELPNALDLLSVCVDAGLGFDQALQRISVYWDSELGHELKRVVQELELGVTRADALKNMSNRLEVDDLSRFIAIIIQAETTGMSYADVLHAQAQQMRVLRQYWVRETANKLPAKMILPLALFIFPALIAVILAPTIPTLLNLF
jgi:tight adherence protein C